MAPHSSTLAWKIPWAEEPVRLQSMGFRRVRQDWANWLSLFTFMHWRRKWQPTSILLSGKSHGQRTLVGYSSWGFKKVRHIHFSSVAQSCSTLWDPMNRSTPGLPVHHQLPEFTQTHIHRVSDAIQPSHPLSSPSPPAPNPSQHQSLFQWVNSLHEVAKVLKFQP